MFLCNSVAHRFQLQPLTNCYNIVCNADLLKALREVKAWYKLGLCLGVPVEVLQEIKKKHISPKKRARKIITAWMEKEITSWDKLVRALDDTGATSLACKVANRYGKLLNLFTAVLGYSDGLYDQKKLTPDVIT